MKHKFKYTLLVGTVWFLNMILLAPMTQGADVGYITFCPIEEKAMISTS